MIIKNYLIIILFSVACKDNLSIDTYKNTLSDEIGDITLLDNYFYTTNIDLSGNAGSQIDLFRFSENISYIEDSFDLEMNGQGYLAITNDGSNLYLQSHWDTYILKVSPIGEEYYMHWLEILDTYNDDNGNSQWDTGETLLLDYNQNGFWDNNDEEWLGSGISYIENEDSLFVLYRFKENQKKLMRRKLFPESHQIGSVSVAEWDVLDSTNSIFAVEHVALPDISFTGFYFLAQDTSGNVILLKSLGYNLDNYSIVEENMESALGLGWDNNCVLYYSFPDRQIVEGINICENP